MVLSNRLFPVHSNMQKNRPNRTDFSFIQYTKFYQLQGKSTLMFNNNTICNIFYIQPTNPSQHYNPLITAYSPVPFILNSNLSFFFFVHIKCHTSKIWHKSKYQYQPICSKKKYGHELFQNELLQVAWIGKPIH